MAKSAQRVPKYCHHKASGQAVVYFDRKPVYLGIFGTPQSRSKYDQLIASYLENGRSLVVANVSPIDVQTLCGRFWAERKSQYVKNGKPTSEKCSWKRVLNAAVKFWATISPDEIGPLRLKELRQGWVESGLSRQVVNSNTRRVVEIFRWGVENELVRPDTWQRLKSLSGLKKGRTTAPEPTPIGPVDVADVLAVIPFLSPTLASMVRVQLLTGARPGEVCLMRPMDIDRKADVWEYIPHSHKTEHHGKKRKIFIGPQAQPALEPFLLRAESSYCYSPTESREWYRQQAELARQTPASCGNARNRRSTPRNGPGTHQPRVAFDAHSYRNAIHRQCRKCWPVPDDISSQGKAAIDQWHRSHRWNPNQLRHTRLTDVRREHGLDGAQVIGGHASAHITQVYAEKDEAMARAIALQSG